MSNALEAAKTIASGNENEQPDPPCEYAQFREQRPCRGHLWMCQNQECEHEGLAVRGQYCRKQCEMREPSLDIKAIHGKLMDEDYPVLSMIFTVYDEDLNEVQATLESAAAAYEQDRLQLIIIDDGAGPVKSAVSQADTGKAEVVYARNKENQGVGKARNQGWDLVYEDADVVSFHDAHMRFPLYAEMREMADQKGHDEVGCREGESSLQALARVAHEQDCITSSASRDTREDRGFYCSGADMFWDRGDGLQPKWQMCHKWDAPWRQTACMMGAGYFIGRDAAERLTSATGQLWEDTAGKWGMSEQALAVKAFLLDIPIWAARDVFTRHLYRGTNPVKTAAKDVWKNVVATLSRLLPPEMFERRILPYAQKRMNSNEIQDCRRDYADAEWQRSPDDIWTHLLGKTAPVTEPHRDHTWLRRVRSAAAAIAASPRVLLWRPGEALFTVLDECPDADITVVCAPGPRFHNWQPICKQFGVRIEKRSPAEDYPTWPEGEGPFDLVLINGCLQDECRETAAQVLADEGEIFRNETADRWQLEDDERKKQEKRLDKLIKKRKHMGDVSKTTRDTTGNHSFTPLLVEVLQQRSPKRIIEWGPGYSTEVMHDLCPEAEIITIEHQEKYARRAEKDYPFAEVIHEPLKDYGQSNYAVWPWLEDAGPFDLAFVDGRRRNECLMAARRVLGTSGVAILHDANRKNYQLGMELYHEVKRDGDTVLLFPKREQEMP